MTLLGNSRLWKNRVHMVVTTFFRSLYNHFLVPKHFVSKSYREFFKHFWISIWKFFQWIICYGKFWNVLKDTFEVPINGFKKISRNEKKWKTNLGETNFFPQVGLYLIIWQVSFELEWIGKKLHDSSKKIHLWNTMISEWVHFNRLLYKQIIFGNSEN